MIFVATLGWETQFISENDSQTFASSYRTKGISCFSSILSRNFEGKSLTLGKYGGEEGQKSNKDNSKLRFLNWNPQTKLNFHNLNLEKIKSLRGFF